MNGMEPTNELQLLIDLLKIPSLSGQEQAASQFLATTMAGYGWQASVDPSGSAVGLVGDQGPLVVLLGHIDTVPGAIPVRAVDAKGPLVTFVAAARRAELAGRLRCRLAIIGATEEEAASSRGAQYARDQYAPVACVIGEPSGWDRITLGYKGRLLVYYRLEQPAAHSAGEQRAAPEAMVTFWQAVERYCAAQNQGRERLFEQIIPSLRRVASGGNRMHESLRSCVAHLSRKREYFVYRLMNRRVSRCCPPGNRLVSSGASGYNKDECSDTSLMGQRWPPLKYCN